MTESEFVHAENKTETNMNLKSILNIQSHRIFKTTAKALILNNPHSKKQTSQTETVEKYCHRVHNIDTFSIPNEIKSLSEDLLFASE